MVGELDIIPCKLSDIFTNKDNHINNHNPCNVFFSHRLFSTDSSSLLDKTYNTPNIGYYVNFCDTGVCLTVNYADWAFNIRCVADL
jgi:hypothetical protein